MACTSTASAIPEINVTGQTPASGASVGYNAVSLERYARRYGLAAPVEPAPGDPQWSAWRREQVTAFVRRLYLDATAAKPRLKLSAALVAFGQAPRSADEWPAAEPSWRVFQDWRGWLREGVIDIGVPMAYRAHHTTSGRESFEQWSDFTASLGATRHTVIGLGAYLNAVEGTIVQARRALLPTPSGTNVGVAVFSMGANNAPVLNNPFSVPADRDTTMRTFEDLALGLTTGRASNGQWLENPSSFTTALFAVDVPVPAMSWKADPQRGHLRGIVRSSAGVLDSAAIAIASETGETSVETTSDGNGFYGAVDLAPATYRVTVTPIGSGASRSQCSVEVRAGEVATLDLDVADGGVMAVCAGTASVERRRH